MKLFTKTVHFLFAAAFFVHSGKRYGSSICSNFQYPDTHFPRKSALGRSPRGWKGRHRSLFFIYVIHPSKAAEEKLNHFLLETQTQNVSSWQRFCDNLPNGFEPPSSSANLPRNAGARSLKLEIDLDSKGERKGKQRIPPSLPIAG